MIGGLAPRRLPLPPGAAVIDRATVLRYLGYRPGRTVLNERAEAVLTAGLVLAQRLVRPAVQISECAVARHSPGGVELASGLAWSGRQLAQALAGAPAVCLIAATVGPALEETVARLFRQDDYALAVTVDAAGTAAVHGTVQAALAALQAERQGGPWRLGSPYSPGYGDWAVTDVQPLLDACRAEAIGLSATATGYLQPQKSLAAVAGWLAGDSAAPAVPACRACAQPDCRYRLTPAAAPPPAPALAAI